jgi:hypothetical protein
MSMKNSNDTIGNRTRDLPACGVVFQPTAPPRAPFVYSRNTIFFRITFFISNILCVLDKTHDVILERFLCSLMQPVLLYAAFPRNCESGVYYVLLFLMV